MSKNESAHLALPIHRAGRTRRAVAAGIAGIAGIAAIAVVCTTGMAAAGQTQEPRTSLRDAVQALPAEYRQWVQSVAGLMTQQELEYFLGLTRGYRRDAFMEAFWEPRPPAIRARWQQYMNQAGSVPWGDPRVMTFLLNGSPGGYSAYDGRIVGRCFSRSAEMEIWFYGQSERAGRDFIIVFMKPGTDAPYQIARPGDNRAMRRSGGLPTTDSRALCGDELLRYAFYEIQRIGDYDRLLLEATRPPVPSPEYLQTFSASTTDLPQGSSTFEASLELAFPVRNQSRTGVQAMIRVPLSEVPGRRFDGELAHDFLVHGEIIRDDRLFESFEYRFEGPTDETTQAIPIGFTRFLRPGPVKIVLLVEDVYGGGFASLDREIDVPSPEGLPSADMPTLASLTGTLDAAEHSLRLLSPSSSILVGLVRFSARHTGELDKVAFYLDDRQVLSKRRPPYSVEVNLGDDPEPHRVRVVGFIGDREVATDQIWLNQGAQRFRVRLVEPRQGGIYPGNLTARVDLVTPDGRPPSRVEYWINDRRLAEAGSEPFDRVLELPSNQLAVVRAVAYLEDGTAAEDAVIVNASGLVEEVDVQLVELTVLVLDRDGQPVESLGREAFRVTEDGVEQTIDRFEVTRTAPLNAALLVDRSASMDPHIDAVAEAALAFSEALLSSPQDRMAVLSFADEATVDQELTAETPEIERALAGLVANGTTALHDGVIQALNYFEGVPGHGALVVFSDGRDEVSRFTLEQAISSARGSGAVVYTLGFAEASQDADTRRGLEELATETGGRAFFFDDMSSIASIYDAILEDMRSGYVLAYTSTSSEPAGEYRELEVEVRGYDVRTRRGYRP